MAEVEPHRSNGTVKSTIVVSLRLPVTTLAAAYRVALDAGLLRPGATDHNRRVCHNNAVAIALQSLAAAHPAIAQQFANPLVAWDYLESLGCAGTQRPGANGGQAGPGTLPSIVADCETLQPLVLLPESIKGC